MVRLSPLPLAACGRMEMWKEIGAAGWSAADGDIGGHGIWGDDVGGLPGQGGDFLVPSLAKLQAGFRLDPVLADRCQVKGEKQASSQAYTVELESLILRPEEENAINLVRRGSNHGSSGETEINLELMENLIPITEMKKPPRVLGVVEPVSEVEEPWHEKSDLELPATDLESDADLTRGTK
ncbi:hypothetical protein OPV22_016742 [Ensete ventricosum]|uniref:Uncharacterized protein n=1 Tax=Ensete ventricosum TaxID=4639 RepID=A0AAV8QZF2_ENSVE|nr:hypothetical protein OPV22_016742 [Ensete ventricosum]